MRFFYAIFVAEVQTRRLLSALRYVCDPHQKYAAHVTVRGPYARPLRRIDVERLSRFVEHSVVDVAGVGSFSGPGQNTVFLRCDGAGVHRIWSKPHLPYIPHLTLYDGPSTDFACRLLNLLGEYEIRFQFTATRLYRLISSGGQQSFELAAEVTEPLLRSFVDDWVQEIAEIKRISEPSRLIFVRALCDLLFASKSPQTTIPPSGPPPLSLDSTRAIIERRTVSST